MNDIMNAFHTYINEDIIKYELMNSNQNIVYLITTKNSSYIIKEFSHDDIKNEEDLKKKKEQINVSIKWNQNKINCAIPITNIFMYQNNYYIIYPYVNGKVYPEDDLSIEKISILAKKQAKMHKMNLTNNLPSHIKKLPIINEELKDIINIINNYLYLFDNNLVICQNDYKPQNIIWQNDKPILIDFDAVSYNHPATSLLESAYTFSYRNNSIDFNYYETYLKEYFKVYKHKIANLEEAIYVCWNGKIQWLNYLINNRQDDKDINDLTNQLINYWNNIPKIKEIIERISII